MNNIKIQSKTSNKKTLESIKKTLKSSHADSFIASDVDYGEQLKLSSYYTLMVSGLLLLCDHVFMALTLSANYDHHIASWYQLLFGSMHAQFGLQMLFGFSVAFYLISSNSPKYIVQAYRYISFTLMAFLALEIIYVVCAASISSDTAIYTINSHTGASTTSVDNILTAYPSLKAWYMTSGSIPIISTILATISHLDPINNIVNGAVVISNFSVDWGQGGFEGYAGSVNGSPSIDYVTLFILIYTMWQTIIILCMLEYHRWDMRLKSYNKYAVMVGYVTFACAYLLIVGMLGAPIFVLPLAFFFPGATLLIYLSRYRRKTKYDSLYRKDYKQEDPGLWYVLLMIAGTCALAQINLITGSAGATVVSSTIDAGKTSYADAVGRWTYCGLVTTVANVHGLFDGFSNAISSGAHFTDATSYRLLTYIYDNNSSTMWLLSAVVASSSTAAIGTVGMNITSLFNYRAVHGTNIGKEDDSGTELNEWFGYDNVIEYLWQMAIYVMVSVGIFTMFHLIMGLSGFYDTSYFWTGKSSALELLVLLILPYMYCFTMADIYKTIVCCVGELSIFSFIGIAIVYTIILVPIAVHAFELIIPFATNEPQIILCMFFAIFNIPALIIWCLGYFMLAFVRYPGVFDRRQVMIPLMYTLLSFACLCMAFNMTSGQESFYGFDLHSMATSAHGSIAHKLFDTFKNMAPNDPSIQQAVTSVTPASH